MKAISILPKKNKMRDGLVVFAIITPLVAGFSGLIIHTSKSPLYIAGAILTVIIVILFLREPTWAVYASIFIALLPSQALSFITIPIIRDYTILLALLFACFSWLLGMIVYHRKIVWLSTNMIMLTFLVWGILTLFWAPNLLLGRQNLVAYTIGFIVMVLLVNNITSPQSLNRLMVTLALNGWILILISVQTIFTTGYVPGTRLEVLKMNENEMGILAMVSMIGVLWQVIPPPTRHRSLKNLLSWIFLLMTIGLVALSGSRGSAISLLITLTAFLFWKPTRKWGLWGLIIVMLGIALVPAFFTTTLQRFAIMEGDTLLGGREMLWQATWDLIQDHLWLGVGIGNGRYELFQYLLQIRGIAGAIKAPTHNPVLQVWAETGLPGILLYLGVPASAVWLFIRQYLRCCGLTLQALIPYFALISSTFMGYMISWIKGGGMEVSFSYYLILSLLLIPSNLDLKNINNMYSSIGREETFSTT